MLSLGLWILLGEVFESHNVKEIEDPNRIGFFDTNTLVER